METSAPQPVKTKRTMKIKKGSIITHAEPEPPTPVPEVPVALAEAPKAKRRLQIKKKSPLPPPVPEHLRITPAVEMLELVREWYESRDEPIPEADIKACLEALEEEKRQHEQLLRDWENPPPPPPPTPEEELGPMPAYGTPEFWRWCMKRKAIRLAKEAAIIAAGGTVPAKKEPKKRVPKEAKAEKK